MVRNVIWPLRTQKQLAAACNYIAADSTQNAQRVRDVILTSTSELAAHPERHPPDRYKKNNDNSFRAYEIYHFRIVYQITDKEIIIVRIRYTKMNPLDY